VAIQFGYQGWAALRIVAQVMPEILEYRGFKVFIEPTAAGWRASITAFQNPSAPIPHHLRQVIRPTKEDAMAEAKSIVDYLIGH
jgi:hypothetical protein